jgi:hypothetical protein
MQQRFHLSTAFALGSILSARLYTAAAAALAAICPVARFTHLRALCGSARDWQHQMHPRRLQTVCIARR